MVAVEALSALGGAIIGGLLVILGELGRQRLEWRRERVRALSDAAIEMARLYNRMCGELIDARVGRAPFNPAAVARPERFEAMTRFFMTPGADLLREEAAALISAHRNLAEAYEADEVVWDAAKQRRYSALLAFEAAVRNLVQRGRI